MDGFFYGRKTLLDLVKRRVLDLKEGYRQNMAFLGIRHVGKTAILQKFLADIDDTLLIPVYHDLDGRDFYYFASKTVRSLLYHYAKNKAIAAQDDIALLLEAVRPALPDTAKTIDAIQALIEKGRFAEAYDKLVVLPEIFTQESGLFCVIVFDEFHVLGEFDIADVFQKLAARITTQKKCFYILASSCEETAKKILSEKLTLLFGNFEIVHVEAFDLRDSQNFIDARIDTVRTGVQLKNFLADFTGGRPLYLDLIAQEMINLSSIFKQQEIYAPIVVQAIENMVFSRWGAISRHFELVMSRVCSGRTNRLVTDLVMALANGHHKVKDIVNAMGARQSQVAQKLRYLIEEDIVERNGSHFHLKDKLMRYWVKYVFERRIRSVEMEPGHLRKEFKEELTRAVSEFQAVCRRDLFSRVTELLHCFDNEKLSLKGRKYKLPVFHAVKPLKMRQRGGNFMDLIQAETDEGPWFFVLCKDPVGEADIVALVEETKKMGVRPRRCVIVSLSQMEDSVRLRALEECMWIWNEPELNSMMNLYDKPYIVS